MNQLSFPTAPPLLYDPDYEVLEKSKAEANTRLQETLLKISKSKFKDSGHAAPIAPAENHGLLRAKVEILDGLPSLLVQGIFAKPGTYPAVMRFSSLSGEFLNENASLPRGLDIKLLGVKADRFEENEGTLFHDVVLMSGPAFMTSAADNFVSSLKLLVDNINKAANLKKSLPGSVRNTEKTMAEHYETNILGDTYYSQIPMLYGPYVAKVSIAPVCPELLQLKDAPVYLTHRVNGLREAVIEFFSNHYAVWELRVQLSTDPDSAPIEIAIARITAKPQRASSDNRLIAIDDVMSLSPCVA